MIEVVPKGQYILIKRDNPATVLSLTWPEANALQADIRQALTEAQITMRDMGTP